MEKIFPLITIIIPVYNTENLLSRCVDSVIAQTYTNIEILLINDGSTDRSGMICDEYSHTDKRVKVIHVPNSGAAAARKIGINKSEGEYVSFVDSDDYVEAEMYERMIEIALTSKIDMVITNTNTLINNQSNFDLITIKDTETTMDSEEALKIFLQGNWLGLWGKLIKKSLFDNVDLIDLKVADDIVAVAQLLHYADGIIYLNEAYYNYVIREGSLTTKKISTSKFHWEIAAEWLFDFVGMNYTMLEKENDYQLFVCKFSLFHRALLSNESIFIEKADKMNIYFKSNLSKILVNMYIPTSKKIASVFIAMLGSYYPMFFRKLSFISHRFRKI